MERIINGYTEDGQPIWRYKTAEEILLEALAKQEAINKEGVETTESKVFLETLNEN